MNALGRDDKAFVLADDTDRSRQTQVTWTLAAVGDVMLDRPVDDNNPAYELLRSAACAFANLETPLTRAGHRADKLVTFRADPDVAAALVRMGLSVVSLANNHAVDYGIEGLVDTLAAARNAGLASVGAGQDLAAALSPAIVHVSDTSVAWLALASTLPVGFAADLNRAGVAPLRAVASLVLDGMTMDEQPGTSPYVSTRPFPEDLKRAVGAVEGAARHADVVLVSLHWGVPPGWAAGFQGVLAEYQRPVGHALVEAGAHVVLGHHPHTLQGIEIHRGRPILYSMGQLVFHALAPDRRIALARPSPPYDLACMRAEEIQESAIFVFHFEGSELRVIEAVPCVLDASGEGRLVTGSQATRILSRLRDSSAALGTDLRIVDERGVLEFETGG